MNHSQTAAALRIGFLVNPWAGIGGPAGLRGSDGDAAREQALARGSEPRAGRRAQRFLAALAGAGDRIEWLTWAGDMGAGVLAEAGCRHTVLGAPAEQTSSARDTRSAAAALADASVDLLLFTGGDGTARDVCAAVGSRVTALGIPAGVKMYSGVFAVSPEAAADIVRRLLAGEPLPLEAGEVRDIDEEAFRDNRVVSRWFGELNVPGVRGQVQRVKCAAPPVDELARQDIAAGVVERMEPGTLYLVGTGTTPKAVMEVLGLPSSLLGIDAVLDRQLLAGNLDARGVLDLLARHPRRQLLLTATGGQGFLLGRGNQQLSAAAIRQLGIDNMQLLATPGKLAALAGRPLLVDSGDPSVDASLAGLRPVWRGYEERVLYRVAAAG